MPRKPMARPKARRAEGNKPKPGAVPNKKRPRQSARAAGGPRRPGPGRFLARHRHGLLELTQHELCVVIQRLAVFRG